MLSHMQKKQARKIHIISYTMTPKNILQKTIDFHQHTH